MKDALDQGSLGDAIERAARIAHEVNRAYCAAIGDHSQLPWDAAPTWQRESAMNGVRFILANPGISPRESHENWLKVKRADGWIYGPLKNVDRKEHPCMLAYDLLPNEQRVKDYLFGAAVRSALA